MIIDNIPLRVQRTKNHWQWLNLNSFRNNHYQVNNKMKHRFSSDLMAAIGDRVKECPEPPVELIYTIYRRDRRKIDLGNIGAILDKFTSDALVYCKMLPDDNTDYIRAITYIDGGVDKQNPRATLEIRHWEQ